MRLPSVPGPRDLLVLGERGGEAVEHLIRVVPRVGRVLDDVERLLADVAALVRRIEGTRQEAQALVERAADPVRRGRDLFDLLEPSLMLLQPTLERLAKSTDPREVDAVVGLVDHLPVLIDQLERDVLPMLTTLRSVAPDLHDLLAASQEVNEMLAKIPGMGRIKKRVEEQHAADEL
jgi:hypothetical protein